MQYHAYRNPYQNNGKELKNKNFKKAVAKRAKEEMNKVAPNMRVVLREETGGERERADE